MAFYQKLAKFLSTKGTNVLLRYTRVISFFTLFLSLENLWSQDMPDGELQIKARDMQCHPSIVTRYLSLLKQIYTSAESSCRVTVGQLAVPS